MTILSALSLPPGSSAFWPLAVKFGIGPVLAVILTVFLMQTVSADQRDTLAALRQHQAESQAALRDQLEMLRIICVGVVQGDTQLSALCNGVGR